MKKLALYIVSFVLLAMSFFAIQKIDAQNSQINLQLLPWWIVCDYSTWYAFPSLTADQVFNAINTLTGNLGTFYCEDLKWDFEWVLSVYTKNLVNAMGHIISDISIKADTNQVIDWFCTTGNNIQDRTDVNVDNWSSPQSILVKNSTEWDICIIEAQNVLLKVKVPQAQPVWDYLADFTVVYPQ